MATFATLNEDDRYEVSQILFDRDTTNLVLTRYQPHVLIDDVAYSIKAIISFNNQNKIYFECVNTTNKDDVRVIALMGSKVLGGTQPFYAALFLDINFVALEDEERVISNKIYNNYHKIVSLNKGRSNDLLKIIPLLDKAKELEEEKNAFSKKLSKLFMPLISLNGRYVGFADDCCTIDHYLLGYDYNEGVFDFDEAMINNDNEILVVDNKSDYECKLSDLHLKDQLKLFKFFHKAILLRLNSQSLSK